MKKSLSELTGIIETFVKERDWKGYKPNPLISSIMIELGELAEHYQWKDDFENFDEEEKLELGFEYVDVVFYLLLLASRSDIDIEKYFDLKMKKLAVKFPLGADTKTQHELYRKTGKNRRYE